MKIRTDLLRVLAGHLISGQLGHEEFYFGHYNQALTGVWKKNGCGTAGCAIGECPIVWPGEWHFGSNKMPMLISKDNYHSVDSSGSQFFGLTYSQYHHLFVPDSQDQRFGMRLSNECEKEDVAANILRFCDLADAGEIPDAMDEFSHITDEEPF